MRVQETAATENSRTGQETPLAFLNSGWRSNAHNRIFQYVSLLYSIFFFISPYYHHSLKRWLWFALFYVVFLALYFGISMVRGRWCRILLGLLFLLGFVYVPFNPSACGVFVYPVVITAFVLREPRTGVALRWFLGILSLQVAAIFLETYLLHLSVNDAENITFWIVVLGLSNFVYSRQQLVSDQLRLANAEIERLAQNAERERIARDLHDLLGHTLTVIVIKSDLANRIFATDPEMAHREMQEVEQTARKALAEVRDAVTGYRAEGLAAGVAQARRALAAAGVQLTTNIEPETLSDKQADTLCMVLREAVTNVARHARATSCKIELLRDGSVMRLTVEDNGTGEFGREGNGIRGMRERMLAIGGELRLQYPKSGGTQLVAEFPVEPQTGASA
jgi:two-component system, NarL family, sensor histidine kinase DesK